MSNRLIGITIFLTVIIAPLSAFLLNTYSLSQNNQHILTPKTQSVGTIKQALDKENNYLPSDERLKNISVTSIKRYDSAWYIASVTYDDTVTTDSHSSIALVGDLRGDPNNLTVILKPEETFPNVNISAGMGVPYDVIDKVNAFYDNRDGKGE